MTIRLNPRWLLISALLLSLQFCRAQIDVPPSISFDLGTSNSPESMLWDISGQYNLDLLVNQRNQLAVPINISFQLFQDGSGKLSGPTNDFSEGLVVNNDPNSVFAITPIISGKVTGSGGFARVHFTVHFTGNGTLAGRGPVTVIGSFTVDAETDPSTNHLVGVKQTKFFAGFSGFPGANIHGIAKDFDTPLPPGVDGSWNLTLDLVGLSKVIGTGIITTPSKAVGLDLSGPFRNDTFIIKARGANDVPNAQSGVGSSATILLTPTFDTIQLSGKLLGQKLIFAD